MDNQHEFTGVFIPAHIWLSKELEPSEKMLLGEIEALSKKTGWCSAGRKHFAKWLNCTESNVSYYTSKLEKLGFIEVFRIQGFGSKMRVVSAKFYTDEPVKPIEGGSKRDLRGVVNGIYGGSKRGLPVNTIEIQKEKKREAEREKLSPSPDGENVFSLEAENQKEQPAGGAAGGALLVTTYEQIAPVTEPPEHRVKLSDRPRAETPLELEEKLRVFYTDWPNEWRYGILENGRGAKHPKEKQTEIVKDFCCWAIENGRGMDTYQRLNARLQKWFRDEQYATAWKQAKPNNQNPDAPKYTPPVIPLVTTR